MSYDLCDLTLTQSTGTGSRIQARVKPSVNTYLLVQNESICRSGLLGKYVMRFRSLHYSDSAVRRHYLSLHSVSLFSDLPGGATIRKSAQIREQARCNVPIALLKSRYVVHLFVTVYRIQVNSKLITALPGKHYPNSDTVPLHDLKVLRSASCSNVSHTSHLLPIGKSRQTEGGNSDKMRSTEKEICMSTVWQELGKQKKTTSEYIKVRLEIGLNEV